MWLVIVVGLGILLLPLIIDAAEWIMIIGFVLLILSWFFRALLWLIPLVIIDVVGQKLINRYYLKTGKMAWLASGNIKKNKKRA